MTSRDKGPDDDFDVSLLEGLRERISQESGDNDEDILSPRSTRKSILFGVMIGVAAAAGAAWFVLGSDPSGDPIPEPSQVPVIQAEKNPIKVRPADPGGMEVPNQDKLVYSRVDKNAQQPEVEHLLPPPAEPKALSKPEDSLGDGMAPLPEAPAIPETPKKANPVPVKTPPPAPVVKEAPKPAPKVVEPKPAPAPKPAPKAEPVAKMTSGAWQVQLTALRDQKRAEEAWARIQKKAGSALNGVPHEIQRADLGSKGVFYRLRAGSFATRDDAGKLCSALKTKGIGCVVAKR